MHFSRFIPELRFKLLRSIGSVRTTKQRELGPSELELWSQYVHNYPWPHTQRMEEWSRTLTSNLHEPSSETIRNRLQTKETRKSRYDRNSGDTLKKQP